MKVMSTKCISKRLKTISMFAVCIFFVLVIISIFGKNRLEAKSSVTYYGDKDFVKAIKMEQKNPEKLSGTKGKKYYIATDGSDNNKGTKDSPYATFDYAISKLKKGDVLYVREGSYRQNVYIPSSVKGTKDKYITIRPYASEKVSILGYSSEEKNSDGEVSFESQKPIIEIDGASYVRIFGLRIAEAVGEDACGILLGSGSNHIILSNNEISNISKGDATGEACANGILLFGESSKKSINNIFIYKNKIHDCDTGWAEACSVTANCKYVNIVSNTVKNITNIGIDLSGNYKYCKKQSLDFPRKSLVYKNKIYNCVSPYATSYGLYVDGGQNIDLIGNTVRECSGGIEVGAEQKPEDSKYSTMNILVKNNTVKDNLENGITVGGYEKNLGWVINVKIQGNTCTNNGLDNSILTLAKCKQVTLSGNKFINESGNSAIVYSEFSKNYTKNISFVNNKYYNGHSSKATYFYYMGKEYTSFKAWMKVVGRKCGEYTNK